MFIRNNYFGSQLFLMTCYFTKNFVYPLIFALVLVCIFSVHKLVENAANIYLFKINNSNARKRCEIWSVLTRKDEKTSF